MNTSFQPLTNCFFIAVACALAPGVTACGAQSIGDMSTDTGNPPVIDEQAIKITEEGKNVIVRGTAGAVDGGADVTVTNVESGAKKSTTAKADGSFQVELPGSASDEYEVEAAQNGKRTLVSVKPSAGSGGFDLVDRAFLLQTADGYTPVKDTTIRLSFREGGEFGFSAGCNGHFGSYTICESDKLCSDGLGSTDIGCMQELQAQDEWLAEFFTTKPSLKQTGTQLVLTGPDATLEFLDEEVADPDRELIGNKWTVDTFITGDAASNFPLERNPTIVFNDDSTVQVFSGCNNGEGTYEEGDGEITFAEVGFDEAGCPDMGSQTAEERILAIFADGVVTFEIDRRRLTLMRGENGIAATTD